MAELMALTGKITMKLDSGLTENGKSVYYNINVGGIKGGSSAAKLASTAETLGGLIALPVAKSVLTRTDLIVGD